MPVPALGHPSDRPLSCICHSHVYLVVPLLMLTCAHSNDVLVK